MKILILFAILVSQVQSYAHGGHMATQTFNFSDSTVELEFKIDITTLAHYSQDIFGVDFKFKKGFILTNYINSKVDLVIDRNPIKFSLVGTQQNEHYLVVKLSAPNNLKSNSTIEITSNIFYEADSQFENRIVIYVSNGLTNSYRLNKENTKLKTQLK